jgi:uncharacterized membrane protein
MMDWISAGPSVLASFMASMVEFVEALTIVLAVGVVRGWRSALLGSVAGVALLVVLVLALGPSLSAVPLPILQLVVGILLMMFGLRWLQKAVLRAAGVVSLHDEAAIYAKQTELLRHDGGVAHPRLDTIAFLASFKAVVLEGTEVVFIVIALGARKGLLLPASLGAGLALLVVVALGLCLHRPLARVPENTLKFGVGVMLAAFGTFWVGEGIGLKWPGAEAAILVLMVVILLVALAMVEVSRRTNRVARRVGVEGALRPAAAPSRWHRLGSEVIGLFVDDAWLAAGILIWTIGAWRIQAMFPVASAGACLFFAAGAPLLLAASTWRRARR